MLARPLASEYRAKRRRDARGTNQLTDHTETSPCQCLQLISGRPIGEQLTMIAPLLTSQNTCNDRCRDISRPPTPIQNGIPQTKFWKYSLRGVFHGVNKYGSLLIIHFYSFPLRAQRYRGITALTITRILMQPLQRESSSE
jgi:hypothetical protein